MFHFLLESWIGGFRGGVSRALCVRMLRLECGVCEFRVSCWSTRRLRSLCFLSSTAADLGRESSPCSSSSSSSSYSHRSLEAMAPEVHEAQQPAEFSLLRLQTSEWPQTPRCVSMLSSAQLCICGLLAWGSLVPSAGLTSFPGFMLAYKHSRVL